MHSTLKFPNLRFFTILGLAFAFILSVPLCARAQSDGQVTFSNRNAASSKVVGSRSVYGSQLAFVDPAVSGSLDTGFVDTAGCQSGCLAAMVEVESATTTASCSTYGGYLKNDGSTIVSALIGSAVTVSASSTSWANSVCPGAATSGAAIQAPLPKYVRIYCAAQTGVNLRGFMACH